MKYVVHLSTILFNLTASYAADFTDTTLPAISFTVILNNNSVFSDHVSHTKFLQVLDVFQKKNNFSLGIESKSNNSDATDLQMESQTSYAIENRIITESSNQKSYFNSKKESHSSTRTATYDKKTKLSFVLGKIYPLINVYSFASINLHNEEVSTKIIVEVKNQSDVTCLAKLLEK